MSLLALLLTPTAHALSCMLPPPGPPLVQTALLGRQSGALYVHWRDHHAPFAHRFRLRAPDGTLVPWKAERLGDQVRFQPTEPLQDDVYTLEHLHRFDEDGRYAPLGGSEPTWYPLEELTPAPTRRPSVTAVRWDQHPEKLVFRADTDAHRVLFEVKGLGEIGGPTWIERDGGMRLSAFDGCLEGYGIRGGDRIRAVLYGPGGAARHTRWVKLHPFAERSSFGGVVRSTERSTWQPVPAEPSTAPTKRQVTACGSLQVVQTRERSVPGHTRTHFWDSARQPHTLGWDDVSLWIDGTTIPLDGPRTPLAVHGTATDLWVHLESERQPSRQPDPGTRNRTIELVHLTPDPVERFTVPSVDERLLWHDQMLRLVRIDAEGVAWRETFGATRTTERVVWPARVRGQRINGRPAQLDEGQRIVGSFPTADALYLTLTRDAPEGPAHWVARYDADGSRLWIRPVEATRDLQADPDAVCTGRTCFTPDGERAPTRFFRRHRASAIKELLRNAPPREPTPLLLDGGTLTYEQGWIWTGPYGASTPAFSHADDAFAIRDGALEIHAFRGEEEVIHRVTCGGPPIGRIARRAR